MTPRTRAWIEALVTDAYPEEGCGAILAWPSGRETVVPWRNVAPDPKTGYAVDPKDYASLVPYERTGARVVGLFHSHPDSPASWSQRDAQGALCGDAPAYPDAIQWVIRLDHGVVTDWRGYRWEAGRRAYGTNPTVCV